MRLITLSVFAIFAATTAPAERLALSFLPPDISQSNVCNAPQEQFEEDETQDGTGGDVELEDSERVKFLIRDIRDLSEESADQWFGYIESLIELREELDPKFAFYDAAFAKIDLYLAARRIDDLSNSGIIQALRIRFDELSSKNKVRLARLYASGLGVEEDRDFALQGFVDLAFLGNAAALFEILHLLQRGETIEGWTLSTERTATLAFGGMVGKINAGICARAERIAREYLDGEFLVPNLDLAYAWRKFAADMGGAEAAWRVVEYHLNATEDKKNDDELLHYLKQAVAYGFDLEPEHLAQLEAAGLTTEEKVRDLLGENINRQGTLRRRSAIPYFSLDVNLASKQISEESDYLKYLQEISALPNVPAPILTDLAQEILHRKGRWAAAEEALPLLRQAAHMHDSRAMTLLADIYLGQGDTQESLAMAEQLLLDSVSLDGHAPAMRRLERLYRCQLPTAPLLGEADYWAKTIQNADTEPFNVTASDVVKFTPSRRPVSVAKIQSSALLGHATSSANLLQILQSDALTPDATLRFWANKVGRNDQALETFAKHEYQLARTPEEGEYAIEFFRRAYLDIGPSIALDLAVALIEDAGSNPDIAEQIRDLLISAGNRGEGAAIRLLQRLDNIDPIDAYSLFAEAIEKRGDFLAFTFAAPFLSEDKFNEYMARAISVMSCRTKDIAEIADAYTARGLGKHTAHWLEVGLAIKGGHILSRLALSEAQMEEFGQGTPPFAASTRDSKILRNQILKKADPDDAEFNPESAAELLADFLRNAKGSDLAWALRQYRLSGRAVQLETDDRIEVLALLNRSAEDGNLEAQYNLAMLLRQRASSPEMLETSTRWMRSAAEAGNSDAMAEYGFALGFGIGLPADPKLALVWLEKAKNFNAQGADKSLRLLRAMVAE